MREDDRGAHGADPGGVTSGRAIVLIVAALLPFTALTLAAFGEGPGALSKGHYAQLGVPADLSRPCAGGTCVLLLDTSRCHPRRA